LHLGANEITLECHYTERHPGLEIAYLLGHFGAQVKGTQVTMTAPPATLRIGDWTRQGLAFYSGNVAYRTTIRPKLRRGERLVVQVPRYAGAGVRVLVDGQPAGVIAWEPNEVDITDLVSGQAADLCIEVLGHRRNSHGPLHLHQKHPWAIGPGHFVTGGKDWTDDYVLVPCGLLAPPRLVIRR
jgi:hypothetical protein